METILPSIQSVMTAVLHYKKMGGEANLYINDDGLQVFKKHATQVHLDHTKADLPCDAMRAASTLVQQALAGRTANKRTRIAVRGSLRGYIYGFISAHMCTWMRPLKRQLELKQMPRRPRGGDVEPRSRQRNIMMILLDERIALL